MDAIWTDDELEKKEKEEGTKRSISDSEMKLLNKNPRPENEHATDLFKNIDAGASSNIDARQFKNYIMSNCCRETRMIKLTLKDGI